MLLDKTQTHVWELKDGKFSILQFDSRSLDSIVSIDDMRNLVSASAFYKHKVEEFFQTEEPGNHVMQMYGSFENRDPHWYELSMMVEQTENGIVRRGTTVMIDQLKKREAMELDTNRMLANAKEKEDFISCMSHEIRTPLNAIVGISELLANMRNSLTQDEIAYFEHEIIKNNALLMKMIEDMLTVTLIDNSGITVQFEELRYSDCTSEVSAMRDENSLNLFGLKIEVVENGEDVPIRADRNLLRRIMTNLFNHEELKDMNLEPCAYGTQWLVKGGKLHLILNQRSQDMLAANGWNTMQYAALLCMFAQCAGLEVGTLTQILEIVIFTIGTYH
jgi:hypothetical protein